jgi:hypothetical protein
LSLWAWGRLTPGSDQEQEGKIMNNTRNQTNTQKFTPSWGRIPNGVQTTPVQAPIPTTPLAESTVTLPRRTFNIILGVAIGASALFVFTVGMTAGIKPVDTTPAPAATVTAADLTGGHRGPDAEEAHNMAQAAATHQFGCQYLWNEMTQGYAVICGEPYSG